MPKPKTIRVRFKCPDCDKFFVDDSSFVPSYECEEDSEFWPKDDGRNCPTCHKFGKNTDGAICPDCNAEIEDVDVQADPDKSDIVGADGSVIMTKKGISKKEAEIAARNKIEEERKERRTKFEAILTAALKKLPVVPVKKFHGEAVVAERAFKVFDSKIVIYAEVALSSSFWFDGGGKPFTLSLRINSEGYKSPWGERGGFNYEAGIAEDFDDIDKMIERAKERVAAAMEPIG